MKKHSLALTALVFVSACGSETGPLGACVDLESTQDGVYSVSTVWRPCDEKQEQIPDSGCTFDIIDHRAHLAGQKSGQGHPFSDGKEQASDGSRGRITTCPICYAPEHAESACEQQ